jgi:hypothetical protein
MHEKRFLLITSFLVVLIGAPAVLSVVREPVALKQVTDSGSESHSPSTNAGESTANGQRRPASVPVRSLDVAPRNAIHSRSVVMNYDCTQKGGDMEVDGTLLRLKGQDFSCMNDKWTDVSITNHSNGFTASVIFLKKGFTTDFIDLKEGENNLEIQAKDDKGQLVTKKFTVKRRAIASVEGSAK